MTPTARVLAPIAIATLLGPLMAGLLFCLLTLATAVIGGSGGLSISDTLNIFTVYLMFAYYEGAKYAVVAGILLAVWMVWRPPGLIAGNCAAIGAIALFRIAAEAGVLSEPDASAMRNNLVLYLVLAVISATACWAVTLPWARRL